VPDALVEQLGDRDVGVLADESDGLAFVPGYGALQRYLDSGEGDATEMNALVLALLQSDAVPSFVFYHLAEVHGEAFGALLGTALGDADFDVEADLDDLLDEFKGDEGDEDDEEDEVVTPDDVVDVRELESTPEGSLFEAARAFLDGVQATLKPETYKEYATAVNMFVHYAVEHGAVQTRQIDASVLLDFLAVWYPRSWSECSAADAKRTITVMGKFTTWLDRERGARVGKQFKSDVQPALKDDLPRVARAIEAVEDDVAAEAFADFGAALMGDTVDDFGTALGSIMDPSGGAEARRGLFTIVTIDGEDAIVRQRETETDAEEVTADEPIRRIVVSEKAVKHLRPGDSIEAVVTPDDGKRWRIWRLVSIYPPAAGL
jgi:hypothetical protein